MTDLSMPAVTTSAAPEKRVYKATGATLFLRAMFARAYPRFIGLRRERSWVIFESLLPLLATIGYIYFYKAIDAPPEFLGFVVLGGAMTAFWLNVLWSMAAQLYWDKDAGNLEIYVVSPSPLMAILMGMAVGGIFMASTRAVIILVVCSLAFQVSYQIASLPLLILVFFLTMAALYGLGMMFASLFLAAGRDVWHFTNLLQEPVYLLSGFFFPVKALGFWVATFASIIPLTLGLDAMRQLIFSGDPTFGFLSVEVEIVILFILSIVFISIAYIMLRKLEDIGRRDGRLIERRK
jgi:ABC-2 type transport system permease protein